MEKNSMNVNNITIKTARYQNSSRTLIYTELVDESGNVSTMTINAPPDNQLGVNPLFDKIVQDITLEKMSNDFKEVELQAHRRKQYEIQRKKSEEERRKMTALLEKKAEAFESPIVEALNNRTLRTAIRKAKNDYEINQMIVAALVVHVIENKLSLDESLQLITNGNAISAPSETHTYVDKNNIQDSEE